MLFESSAKKSFNDAPRLPINTERELIGSTSFVREEADDSVGGDIDIACLLKVSEGGHPRRESY